ncbi:MAG: hypothetical protein M1268_04635 [Patescibacteria group bacterium]|nr:hypothetical protein [Patescibacteria group bacterium]
MLDSSAEISPAPEIKTSDRISLYKSQNLEVFIPKKPNIPLNEGLHVRVSGQHDSMDPPKQVLSRYLEGLGVAKVIAESGVTRELWANTRLEKGQVVSVYGRVPGEVDSWRKPVDTNNREAANIDTIEPQYPEKRLQELCQRYLPKWDVLAQKMELFGNGVKGSDLEGNNSGDPIIWENDTLTVQIIKNRHLDGYHLVVNPKEGFSRQWQTVKETRDDKEQQKMIQKYVLSTIEATAVAMGVRQLLSGGRGEIHNSGNWAGGLKTIEEGGKLSMQELDDNLKKEKKLHRADLETSETRFGTSMHAHVYIPKEGDVVVLPPMSLGEAKSKREDAESRGLSTQEFDNIINQWEVIPPTSEEQMREIQAMIGNGKLTKWLEENCRGPLITAQAA